MKPFEDYPNAGQTILKKMGRTNTRREDGLWLMDHTKQTCCAYCNLSLVDTYEHWLLVNVDHVIPTKECELLGIPKEWYHSFSNTVLACFGCNLFDNRYQIEWQQSRSSNEWTVPMLVALRDKVFQERRQRIQDRRADEVRFYERNIRR